MVAALMWLALVGAPGTLDPVAVEAHLDATVPARLAEAGIEGAVVSVVTRDGTRFVGGWGLADVATDRPMDGDTVVRVASISKTFTASAVAQLVAEGRMDLDADVQAYLGDLRFPLPWDQPVTLRHLLGHTSGIINNNVGRVGQDAPPAPLREFIAATMPPRVYAPGAGVLYSNHGNALAGLAVQTIVGTDFEDHIATTLLSPLQMGSSSFRLDETVADRLAKSYVDEGETRVEQPYLYFGTVPASALHTTAADMANYMQLHLGDGTFDGRRVLAAAAIDDMKNPRNPVHPALPGYHYAFFHGETAGHPTRAHGGSAPAFLSQVVLFDDLGVGVFVAQNGFGTTITRDIVDDLARTFLPAPRPRSALPVLGDGRPSDPDGVRGRYRALTATENPTFTRGSALIFADRVHVDTDDDGFLRVDGVRFLQVSDLLFARDDDDGSRQLLAFVRGPDGEVAWVHRDAHSALRTPWHADDRLHLGLYGVALLVLIGARLSPLSWHRLPPAARRRTLLPSYAARFTLLGVVGPHLYAAWIDQGQPVYLTPLRFGAPAWLLALGWLPWGVLVIAIAATAWDLTHRVHPRITQLYVATSVAVALLCGLDLYWRAAAPGMVGS
jgi:CubicO group peptidase (beta-lactamase class C family)